MESAQAKHPLQDQAWWLNNLYQFRDQDSHVIAFRLNWTQEALSRSGGSGQ